MKNTKAPIVPIVLTALLFLMAIPSARAQDIWNAPRSADEMANPLKNDASASTNGKSTYKMLCVICHGAKGKGDGIGGAGLTPKPTDLTSADVQAQTDGALFWKLTEGRPPMAPYMDVLPETKRWELVNYIRTLKK